VPQFVTTAGYQNVPIVSVAQGTSQWYAVGVRRRWLPTIASSDQYTTNEDVAVVSAGAATAVVTLRI